MIIEGVKRARTTLKSHGGTLFLNMYDILKSMRAWLRIWNECPSTYQMKFCYEQNTVEANDSYR